MHAARQEFTGHWPVLLTLQHIVDAVVYSKHVVLFKLPKQFLVARKTEFETAMKK